MRRITLSHSFHWRTSLPFLRREAFDTYSRQQAWTQIISWDISLIRKTRVRFRKVQMEAMLTDEAG